MKTANNHSRENLTELRGNLHIHTDQSDGTLPLEKVIRLARKAQIDFIGVNDHFAPCGPSYYKDGLLILPGTELNKVHSHYLAYGCPNAISGGQRNGSALAADIKRRGGLGIIAHPFEKGSPVVSAGRCYPWLDWDSEDFQAIEIWNLTSQWRDSVRSYWQGLCQWLFRRYQPFSEGACLDALAKWDELCLQRHVTGVAGSDIHAPKIGFWRLKFRILGYSMLFGTVNTYCLARSRGDGAEDGEGVIDALKAGRCWSVYDRLGLGRGFSFSAGGKDGVIQMGETMARQRGKAQLYVSLPKTGAMRLIHNGRPIAKVTGQNHTFDVTAPGAYRVEAWQKGAPWIYGNPVYLL